MIVTPGRIARARPRQCGQHGAIVVPVAARLDEHGSLQADLKLHVLVRLQRRLGPVRSSDPESQEGRVPWTGKLSQTISCFRVVNPMSK